MERQSDRNQESKKGGEMNLDNMKKIILGALKKARKK